jgi:hypothetical protein
MCTLPVPRKTLSKNICVLPITLKTLSWNMCALPRTRKKNKVLITTKLKKKGVFKCVEHNKLL